MDSVSGQGTALIVNTENDVDCYINYIFAKEDNAKFIARVFGWFLGGC